MIESNALSLCQIKCLALGPLSTPTASISQQHEALQTINGMLELAQVGKQVLPPHRPPPVPIFPPPPSIHIPSPHSRLRKRMHVRQTDQYVTQKPFECGW